MPKARARRATSPPIRPEAEFPILPGTEQLHLGVLVALLAVPVLWLILNRTTFGFAVKAVGENARAAAYAGISTQRTILATAALSGALAGLAGAGEVGGVHYQVMADLSPGYGYTGIVIAMLVLLPEGLAALRAARANRLQTCLNLALGSALASIGLTIPAVAAVALAMGLPLQLGLGAKDEVLLALTLFLGAITLGTGRTTILQGIVHLVIFAAFVVFALLP